MLNSKWLYKNNFSERHHSLNRGFFIGRCSCWSQSELVFQLKSSSRRVFMIGFGPSSSFSFLASLSNASSVSRVYLKLPSFSNNDTQYFFTSTSRVLWRRMSKKLEFVLVIHSSDDAILTQHLFIFCLTLNGMDDGKAKLSFSQILTETLILRIFFKA